MSLEKSAFRRLTTLVTARDLQQPFLPSVEEKYLVSDWWDEFVEEDIDSIVLVERHGVPIGCWSPIDSEADELRQVTVDQQMDPIPMSMIVSADATYYEIADAFAHRDHWVLLVIQGARFSGWISYLDLFSSLGQICLFSLALFLESVSEELCLSRAEDCWNALDTNSRKKAQGIVKKRGPEKTSSTSPNPPRASTLINATSFADKGTMLSERGLIDGVDKEGIEDVFKDCGEIRNLCAHVGSNHLLYSQLPKHKLSEFLHKTQDLIMRILAKLESLRPKL